MAISGTIALAALGGYAVASAMSNSAPSLPPVKPPPVMPTANDSAVREAKRRSLQAQALRHGRASTILTDQLGDSDTLG